jgi:hypothetical protein
MAEVDWTHRESLRMWRVLAARGHEGAQQVVSHHGLASLPAPAFAPAPAPAPIKAVVPRAPRAVVPTAPQPTVALTGVQRRVAKLTQLIAPPVPPDLI